MMLGSELERALRQAATAAVRLTSQELCPAGGVQAEQLALVLTQVFSVPVHPSQELRPATLLEALQTGVASQLAPLDDAALTGTGRSSSDLLEVSSDVLAQKLTRHLVDEIVVRGTNGGPLAPLAAQLNHDLTHLQGERLRETVGQLADNVRSLAELDNERNEPADTASIQVEPRYRTMLLLEIARRSPLNADDKQESRIILLRMVEESIRAAGIGAREYELNERGDGALLLLDPAIPTPTLLNDLLPALVSALSRQNEGVPANRRIQLRVAADSGNVTTDSHGYAGKDLNSLLRLLEAAGASGHFVRTQNLSIVLSDRIRTRITEHTTSTIAAENFRYVHLIDKGGRRPAWIYAPDSDEDVLRGPSGLPPASAHFTGREAELERLHAWLGKTGNRSSRLVVISGIGGVGKTALAIQAAHQLAPLFPDGQLFVSLHGAATGLESASPYSSLLNLLLNLGADSQRLPAHMTEAAELLQTLLADRRVLLLLDDAASATQVRELLPANSTCATIVTSRRDLPTLDTAARLHLDIFPEDQAIELLGRVIGTQRLVSERDAVLELAAQCGYLPLALSIAGAQLASHPQWQVARLVEVLSEERGHTDPLNAEDLPTRSFFEATYVALQASPDADDKVAAHLFRLLGFYPGPDLGLGQAAALLNSSLPRTIAALTRLRESNLLTESEPHRYRMHNLLLPLAQELANSDDTRADWLPALRRLLIYYKSVVSRGSKLLLHRDTLPHLGNVDERIPELLSRAEALAWFDAERANLKAILRHAIAIDLSAEALPIAEHLFIYQRLRKQWTEAAALQELLLTTARERRDSRSEARILTNLAVVYSGQRRSEDALAFLEQSLSICRLIGDRNEERRVLTALGVAYRQLGDLSAAAVSLEQSLQIAREIQDRFGECETLTNLGDLLTNQDLIQEARERYQSVITLAQQIGDLDSLGRALIGMGAILRASGALQESARQLQRALAVYRNNGYEHDEAAICASLGSTFALIGAIDQAITYFQQSLAVARDLGDERSQIRALVGLGEIYTNRDQYDVAVRYLTQAVQLTSDISEPRTAADTYSTLAAAYRRMHDLEGALYCGQRALEIIEQMGDKRRQASCLVSLARTYSELGRSEQSVSCYEYGLGLLRDLHDPVGEAITLERLAAVQRKAGRVLEAQACLQRSSELRASAGLTMDDGNLSWESPA